jgi:hypothetical protein
MQIDGPLGTGKTSYHDGSKHTPLANLANRNLIRQFPRTPTGFETYGTVCPQFEDEFLAVELVGLCFRYLRDSDRATSVAFLLAFLLFADVNPGQRLLRVMWPVSGRVRYTKLVLDPVSPGEALSGVVEQPGHRSHGKQHVKHRLVCACLDLDSAVRVIIQDEVRENVVNDLVWRLAEEVLGWVNGAVECIGEVVFVERVEIFTRDLFNIVGVLGLLGQLSLLVSGVVARCRRSFEGDFLLWLMVHVWLRLLFRSYRLVIFIVG